MTRGAKDTDDFTPITDMRGMGEALAVIKRDVKEMRPEVREARDGVIKLTEWKGTAERKLEDLERKSSRAHDCAQVEIIAHLQEQSREASVEFATQKAAITSTTEEVKESKASRSTLGYAILGIIVTVLGSVGGWVWTMATLRADVSNLREQQMEVRQEIKQVGSLTKAQTVEVQSAIKTVKTAVENGPEPEPDSVEGLVQKLSPSERERLRVVLARERSSGDR